MSTLQVEVEDFVSAARTMHHDIAESVRITLDGVAGTLHANTDLVGEDPAGSSWASAYDPAARSVLDATAQIINAAFRTSQLFAQSGANYEQAEAASTARGQQANRPELAQLAAAQPKTHAPRLPSAAGAGNGTPAGWWLVEHTVGYVWPGGHQDRLRATADGWRRAAGGIENVAFEPVLITALFARDKLPEADDIATVCTGFHNRLDDLARGYRGLGRACDEYVHHLDECHEAVREALTELMAESAGIQVVGALASFFSFGAAEAPTQATQAGLIAAAAARIGGLIEKVVAAARRISDAVRAIKTTAEETVRVMTGVADARLAYAGVTDVGRVARATKVTNGSRGAGRGLRMNAEARGGEGLVRRAPSPGKPGGFRAPRVVRNRHGELTNGEFRILPGAMLPHTSGSLGTGKSLFFASVDADRAVLDAAPYARRHGLFSKDGKAKVFIENGPVGVWGKNGEPTQWINIYRKTNGAVHGSPGGPP